MTPAAGPPRSLLRAALAGAAVAFALFALLLTYGRPYQLLPKETLGNFYDAQAESFQHGHLTVDPNEVSFEGFRIGNRTYEYQGPVPALARLPLTLITHRFHGRLTRVSMLLADLMALWYLARLMTETRRIVRGVVPATRLELAWTAIATFGLGTSSLLYLASKAWVYHEALLWGAALALGALFHLTALLARPTPTPFSGSTTSETGTPQPENEVATDPDPFSGSTTPETGTQQPENGGGVGGGHHLGWAVALAGLALLTRSSVGAGPIAALAVLAGVQVVRLLSTRGGREEGRWSTRLGAVTGWRPTGTQGLALLVLGVLVPVGIYMAVNQAKFGSLASLPADKQVLVKYDPAAQRALAANHNSLFSPKFTPSVVVQSLRPDGVSFSSHFPFVGFPAQRPKAYGGVLFEELDWSSSLPASEPLLLVFGLIGLVGLVSPRRVGRSAGLVALRVPLLGAMVGGLAFVTIGYIANRYYSDLFPLLAVATIAGIQVVAGRVLDARAGRAGRVAMTVALVVLALWGAWANLGLGLEYQRVIAPGAPSGSRASWIRWQSRLGATPSFVRVGIDEPLPPDPALGAIAVVGTCDGLYRSNGSIWQPIEGTDRVGQFDHDLMLTAVPTEPITLISASHGDMTSKLLLEPVAGGRVQFVASTGTVGHQTHSLPGPATVIVPGRSYRLAITFDWRQAYAEVDHGSQSLLAANTAIVQAVPHANPAVPGRFTGLPQPTPACHALGA